MSLEGLITVREVGVGKVEINFTAKKRDEKEIFKILESFFKQNKNNLENQLKETTSEKIDLNTKIECILPSQKYFTGAVRTRFINLMKKEGGTVESFIKIIGVNFFKKDDQIKNLFRIENYSDPDYALIFLNKKIKGVNGKILQAVRRVLFENDHMHHLQLFWEELYKQNSK